MHLERIRCMGGYPLLCWENHLTHTTLAESMSTTRLDCLFGFYILIISQHSHHLHFNLSRRSLKGTFKKKTFIYISVCVFVEVRRQLLGVSSLLHYMGSWRSNLDHQAWRHRPLHAELSRCWTSHWPTITFEDSLVKICLGLHCLVHCYFLHEVHYTEDYWFFEVCDVMLHH